MNALSLVDVKKNFAGLTVLAGVDLDVRHGERHAVIGPNGAGKSTLFNLISGRLRPSAGRILWRGADIAGRTPQAIARLGIGRSFQIINVFPRLSVADNVAGAVASKLGYRWSMARSMRSLLDVRRATDDILETVGLSARAAKLADSLSYGEQRRLELALTLALDPQLMLLDEPCAGLNAADTNAAVALIRRVSEGRALLMVEHDMNVVFELADRVSVLYYGRVLATGTPAEVRDNKEVQAAYLGRRPNVVAAR